MIDWFTIDGIRVAQVIISTLVIYGVVIALTRLCGLRSFATMSAFDYAMTVAIGTLIGSSAASTDPSIAAAGLALAVLYAIMKFLAIGRVRTKWLTRLIDNEPLLLMRDGVILEENLRRAQVIETDLYAKLREANVGRFDEVHAVVLETTGAVSVIHSKDAGIDDRLLQGVRS
ncbi:MAG: DUF421 domain-containing protein [Phycisphaerales bacterium]